MYKSIFSSVTFWGVMVSLVSKVLLAFDVFELDAGYQAELANWLAVNIPLAIGLVGDVIALWGRANASKPIKTNLLTSTKVKRKRRIVHDARTDNKPVK